MPAQVVAEGSLVLYASPRKIGGLLALSLLFVVGGVALAHAVGILAGIGAVPLGLFAFYAAAREIATLGRPAILFDRSGITFRKGRAVHVVAWPDLARAYVVAVRRQRFVALLPRDVAGAIASAIPVRRSTMQLNVALIGAPLTLPATTSMRAEALLAIVARYAPEVVF